MPQATAGLRAGRAALLWRLCLPHGRHPAARSLLLSGFRRTLPVGRRRRMLRGFRLPEWTLRLAMALPPDSERRRRAVIDSALRAPYRGARSIASHRQGIARWMVATSMP